MDDVGRQGLKGTRVWRAKVRTGDSQATADGWVVEVRSEVRYDNQEQPSGGGVATAMLPSDGPGAIEFARKALEHAFRTVIDRLPMAAGQAPLSLASPDVQQAINDALQRTYGRTR